MQSVVQSHKEGLLAGEQGEFAACRYFFSTLLSLWNRTLLGKGHGVLGKGAFPGERLGRGSVPGT